MSGEELRAQSAVFIADGAGLAHEYPGAYPHAAYDMGNLDYHRDMIPSYDAAGMYMGHSAENMYSSAAYADPSVYHSAHAAYPQAVVSCGYPAFPPQALMSHEAYPGLESSSSSPGGRSNVVIGPNGKPKRRRVATIAQRRAANIRERRRMFNLNEAFDLLRKRVPTFAYEKRLSRIETLRLAITYISFMADIVDGKNPKDIKLLSLKGASGINWSLPVKREDGDEDDVEDDEGQDEEDKNTENGQVPIQPVSPAASESEGRDIPVTAE